MWADALRCRQGAQAGPGHTALEIQCAGLGHFHTSQTTSQYIQLILNSPLLTLEQKCETEAKYLRSRVEVLHVRDLLSPQVFTMISPQASAWDCEERRGLFESTPPPRKGALVTCHLLWITGLLNQLWIGPCKERHQFSKTTESSDFLHCHKLLTLTAPWLFSREKTEQALPEEIYHRRQVSSDPLEGGIESSWSSSTQCRWKSNWQLGLQAARETTAFPRGDAPWFCSVFKFQLSPVLVRQRTLPRRKRKMGTMPSHL